MNNARDISGFTAASRILMFALIGSLSACDFLYGVRRSAPIQVDPTPECVERVLWNTPGVDSVEHKQSNGDRPLTLSGIKSPTLVETFFCKGPGNVRAVLQYTKDYAGRLEFWQSNLDLNRAPPQEDITATRPIMRKVELALESECGLSGLAAHVTEWCRKEVCGPLQ
jgi:hypothetical protein